MFAAAPWLSGFIHEASHGVPSIGVHPPMVSPRVTRDRYIMASDRHRHFVNAQGSLARDVMNQHGKIFGQMDYRLTIILSGLQDKKFDLPNRQCCNSVT